MASDAPEPDMTAAELALGVLDGEERAAALRRMLAEPDFAREVDYWRDRLADLLDGYRSATPPGELRDRVLHTPSAPARRGIGWGLVGLAMAVAAAIVLVVAIRPPTPLPPPPTRHVIMVAALTPTDKAAPPVSAAVDMTSDEVRVPAAALAPAGKAAQLWVIKGSTPYSLGLLSASKPTALPIDPDAHRMMVAGATLAISIEPAGGSPKPTPTGPVVASGALSAA